MSTGGSEMGSDAQQGRPERAAMRAAFWTWVGIIVVGLAVMIGLPLAGR